MENKELIEILKRELGTVESNNVVDIARDEIIQRLREHDEIRKIALDAVDPLIELYNFLIGLADEQEGDINYERKK